MGFRQYRWNPDLLQWQPVQQEFNIDYPMLALVGVSIVVIVSLLLYFMV